ncbi:MAG: tyrosine-type recombinase/integrase [Promethearchaeota archaeon]
MVEIGRLVENPWKGVNKKYTKADEKVIPYLDAFLRNYSDRMKPMIRNKVIYFHKWCKLRFIREGLEDILTFEHAHTLKFLERDINKRKIRNGPKKGEPIKLVTKEKWRIAIKKYYDFIIKIYKIEGKIFINPVPDSDIYHFDKPKTDLAKIKRDSFKRKPNYNHALKLLNYAYYEDFELYIALGFLIWSCPRIEELVSIEVANIEIPEKKKECHFEIEYNSKIHIVRQLRFILTELKRTKKEDKSGVYCYPKFFITHLELYLAQKELIYPGDPYLFPSPLIKGQPVNQKYFRDRLRDARHYLNIDLKITPHMFRKLTNTYRKRMGVDPDDRALLLNHEIDRVESTSYNLDFEEFARIQVIYNNSFPYPDFTPNPNYKKIDCSKDIFSYRVNQK